MDLQDPTSKMSKSADTDAGCVYDARRPGGDHAQVQAGGHRQRQRGALRPRRQARRDATCSRSSPRATGATPARCSPTEYTQYGRLKTDAGEAVVELLEPIQARYTELIADPAELVATAPHRVRQGPRGRLEDARARLRRDRLAPRLSRPRPAGRLVGRFLDPTDRRLVALAVPALGTLAVEPLYVLVDTAIVGRLGTAQLAGLALAATVLSFVVVGSNFLTYGTTERVARRVGAGDRAGAADVGVQAMWLSVLVGRAGRGPARRRRRDRSAGCSAGLATCSRHATDYLQISAVGIPFVLVTLAAQGVLRGVSAYRLPLVILFVSNLVNTVLEIVFVFGLDLGIPGSAWSTVIAQAGAAVGFAVVIRPHLRPAVTRRPAQDRDGPAGERRPPPHAPRRRDAGRVRGIDGDRGPDRRADVGGTPDRGQLLLVPRPVARRPRRPGPDARRRRSRPGLGGGGATTWRRVLSGCRSLPRRWSRSSSRRRRRGSPTCSPATPSVASRTTAALWFLAVMMFPAAIAFAHDGVLIGAGDYRFLGRAAVGYLVAVAPLAALVLVFRDLGIAGIWAAFTIWMVIRAVANHYRTNHILGA